MRIKLNQFHLSNTINGRRNSFLYLFGLLGIHSASLFRDGRDGGRRGRIGPFGKVQEEQDERKDVERGDTEGHDATGHARGADKVCQGVLGMSTPIYAAGNEGVSKGQGQSDEELGQLHIGHQTLPSRLIPKTGEGVVKVHEGVDEGVEADKDPGAEGTCGGQHPHGDDGARMMVGLQEGGRPSLYQQDGRVQQFVIFAHVEYPGPEADALKEHAVASITKGVVGGTMEKVLDQHWHDRQEGVGGEETEKYVMGYDGYAEKCPWCDGLHRRCHLARLGSGLLFALGGGGGGPPLPLA